MSGDATQTATTAASTLPHQSAAARSADAPPPLSTPSTWSRQRRLWLPLISLVVVMLSWEYGVQIFDVPRIILPPLSDVVQAWWGGFVTAPRTGAGINFIPHLWVTSKEVGIGFVLGMSLGVVTGTAVALSRTIELMFKPFIVAIYATPKIAIAPLLIIVLGFDIASKVAVVLLVAWMPVFTNVITGLRAIEPPRIELLKVMGASQRQILTKVRIPMSLPYLFSGVRTALLLSLLGAIAAEFVGSKAGMGYIMILRMSLLDTASVLALVLTLMMIGVFLFTTTEWIQKRVLFWSDS